VFGTQSAVVAEVQPTVTALSSELGTVVDVQPTMKVFGISDPRKS
jgi:hypothetical protein